MDQSEMDRQKEKQLSQLKKMGQYLIEKKLISEEQLRLALGIQTDNNKFLGQIFVEKGWVTEEQVLMVLADQYKMPFVRLQEAKIDKAIMEILPLKLALHYRVMPVKVEGSRLVVAISNPQDIRLLDGLSLALHHKFSISPVLSSEVDIDKAVARFYGLGAETIGQILETKEKSAFGGETFGQETLEDIQKGSGAASVIRLVNQILLEAHERRATDVHFEPYRGKFRLRYRVDGMLETVDTPDDMRRLFPAIISRIKVLSGLDLVERRIPQDGRASVTVGERKLDLRTSILPSSAGEGVVIRILPDQMILDLKDLGLSGNNLQIIESNILKPYGLIFVTGPTGSGKSTTLYSCLKRINKEDTKIITVEDPVEYELEGALQVPINPAVGLTFAKGLRSMLRHDPDVMMVGEVRDLETAELAIRIALTGHLVLSTLHTNDSASGFTRLMDMGIPPFLLVSSIRCLVAQRLIRLLCPHCKKEEVSDSVAMGNVFKAVGCPRCHGSGYWGRKAIYEVLQVTPAIRKLVMAKASSDEIKAKAIEEGMQTLGQEGLIKVQEGLTTIEEVMRISTDDL
jgi:type IV pilus assembly protein PilB